MLVGALGNVGYLESLAIWIFDSFGSNPVMLAVAVVWVSAIASAIIELIVNPRARRARLNAAAERLPDFTWTRAAAQTLTILEREGRRR